MPELKLSLSPGVMANLDIPGSSGVAANIYVNSGTARDIRDITLPVGVDFRSFNLPVGEYTIECILPSGEILMEDIELGTDDAEHVLYAEESTNEWMTRQKYSQSPANQQPYRYSPIERISMQTDVEDHLRNTGALESVTTKEAQVFGKGAAAIWSEMIVGADIKALESNRKSIELLVFDRLFDVSELEPIRGKSLWNTIADLSTGAMTFEAMDLLAQCEQAVRSGHPSIEKISPESQSNDQISLYRVANEPRERLRRILLWSPFGIEIIILPNEWKSRGGDESLLEIAVDKNVSSRRFRTSVIPDDTKMISILSYMNAGAMTTAANLTRQAEDLLWGKVSNPLAATIGAYILVTTDQDRERRNWPRWIENLARVASWLPDATVLRGWLELMNKDIDSATNSFVRAFEIGVPLFRPILQMQLDALRMLSRQNSSLVETCQQVQHACLCVNPTQAFTIFQLGQRPKNRK